MPVCAYQHVANYMLVTNTNTNNQHQHNTPLGMLKSAYIVRGPDHARELENMPFLCATKCAPKITLADHAPAWYKLRGMDEHLMPIGTVWDLELQQEIKGKVSYVRKEGRKIDKEGFLQDVEGVYHAIGGFERLVHLATNDPKWFMATFKHSLLPNQKHEVDLNVVIQPALARSPLDEKVDPNVLGRRPGQRALPAPPLDQGSDQASWSAPQGVGSSPGLEDPSIEDEEGGAFE